MTDSPTLFDEDETVLEDLDDSEEEYLAIAKTIGEEFEKAMDKRADMTTFNWLMRYGVPKTPLEVRLLIANVPPVMFLWAQRNGYITFTDKALMTEEEAAKAAEREAQSSFEDLGNVVPIGPSPYL